LRKGLFTAEKKPDSSSGKAQSATQIA